MPPVARNRCNPWELTDDDVMSALARIRERDEDLAREAEHVYATLTWGDGPSQIRRARVQDWLWYQMPTEHGDWGSRNISATEAGEQTLLAILRAAATGPKQRPW